MVPKRKIGEQGEGGGTVAAAEAAVPVDTVAAGVATGAGRATKKSKGKSGTEQVQGATICTLMYYHARAQVLPLRSLKKLDCGQREASREACDSVFLERNCGDEGVRLKQSGFLFAEIETAENTGGKTTKIWAARCYIYGHLSATTIIVPAVYLSSLYCIVCYTVAF